MPAKSKKPASPPKKSAAKGESRFVPEELVPVRAVGRMVLNRNPDNLFAETEQVAFCTAHFVPGIDLASAVAEGLGMNVPDPLPLPPIPRSPR